jgi:chorismate dehydratase
MKPLRLSAISYLNTAPLMWDFEHASVASEFDIAYTLPSQCAFNLKNGSADIGIIPAAAYTTVPNLAILPGVAIASRRAVRSILLVSKVPLLDIRTVALDSSSLTSVALLKILFAKWWGGARKYTSLPPDAEHMLREQDAALLIGDPALQLDRSRYVTCDLAEEWIRFTGKPFVFAFWAVRREALKQLRHDVDLAAIFRQSRDHGLASDSIKQIAKDWAPKLRLSEHEIRTYLTENIHYSLDPACVEGMKLFFHYAAQYAALPPAPDLYFLEHSPAVL